MSNDTTPPLRRRRVAIGVLSHFAILALAFAVFIYGRDALRDHLPSVRATFVLGVQGDVVIAGLAAIAVAVVVFAIFSRATQRYLNAPERQAVSTWTED